jgi:hypothetical protein
MQRKLGRKAIKTDSRTLKFAKYLTASLPAAPDKIDWTKGTAQWGMMLNDTLGDCTIAALGHAVQVWTLNSAGAMATISDESIRLAYERWCGYHPGNDATDCGGIPLDVLTDFKKMGLEGHKLNGFASASPSDLAEIKQGINLFCGAYIGMEVPKFIIDNEDLVDWDVKNLDEEIEGGHEVYCTGYGNGKFDFISWGKNYTMTEAYFQKYVDDAKILLGADLIGKNGSPEGFNMNQLLVDLSLIR